MTQPDEIPEMPQDALDPLQRLSLAIGHLFPGQEPQEGSDPVSVAIGLLTAYAMDLATQEHMVEIQADGRWSIWHPLVCRSAAEQCDLHQAFVNATAPPVPGAGIYTAERVGDVWMFRIHG